MPSTTRSGFSHALSARFRSALQALAAFAAATAVVLFAGMGQAGQERYEYDPIGRLIRFTDSNNEVTEYTYDKAGNILSVVRGAPGSNLPPSLTAVTPSVVRVGNTASLTITGERLQVGTLQTSDAGLDLANVRQTATQVLADLTVASSVPSGGHTLTFTNAQGSARIGLLIAPPLPTLSVEPSPLALPPDNVARAVTLRLSSPDVVAHQLTVTSSNTTTMTVSPATLTIPAGQTTAVVNVTPKKAGFANLVVTSPTLKTATAPVFITSDFRGVNTSYAAAVGVQVGDAEVPAPPRVPATFVNGLGVVVGPVLTGVTPAAATVGGTYTFTITGAAIPAGVQVSALPAEDVSVAVLAGTGNSITVSMAIAANAKAGPRRFVVRDAAGALVPFAPAAAGQVRVTSGQPTIASIEPLFTTRGTITQIRVRGAHLQDGLMLLAPGIDLAVDSVPTVNATGTELTARVHVSPLAATGARTVQIVTPSGDSGAAATAANQFTVVSEIKESVSPIFAPPLGVMVGGEPQQTRTLGPLAGSLGVTVGPVAFQASPRVAVIGTSVTVVVQGAALQAVTGATLSPSQGLTVGAFTVAADGSSLSFPVTIDPAAARGPRRVALTTASGRLHFSDLDGDQILVATPAPELTWVKPQVVQSGKTTAITIRGLNFHDVSAVAFEPPTGLTAVPPFTVTEGGQVLTFNVQATADAPSGTRTVRVTTAGGTSTAEPLASNTFQLAKTVGATYDAITSVPLGIVVGEVPQPTTSVDLVSLLGVVVSPPDTPVTESRATYAPHVGVLVGAAPIGLAPRSPEGFLKGTTGTLTVTGIGLDGVTTLTARGHPGLTLGQHQVNADGTQLTVPVTVPGTATSAYYSIGLATAASSARLVPLAEHDMFFSVGALPTTVASMAPIVVDQGKSYEFTVRGTNLRDVYEVLAEPAAGVDFIGTPQWSSDSFGEKLTVQMRVTSDAAVGVRVVRLRVPGGLTTGEQTESNKITVVTPQ